MKRWASSKFSRGRLVGPEAVLIGDHDEGEARPLQLEQRRHDARHQADLLQTVHLLVGRLLGQACRPGPEIRCGCRSRRRLQTFEQCIVLRPRAHRDAQRLSAGRGGSRRSRTMVPPAMLKRMNRSASRQSISRKFASLGHTRSTKGEASRRSRRYSRSPSSAAILAREARAPAARVRAVPLRSSAARASRAG